MSPKATTTKAPTKKSPRAAKPAGSTEKLRKAAIAEIEQRIAGTETATAPKNKRAKAAKPEQVAKPAKPKRGADAKRPSGLDLASKALEIAGQPLNAQQLAAAAIELGWQTSGKTPHATLYAAVIREIAAKGRDSRFTKTDRGLFASNRKAA